MLFNADEDMRSRKEKKTQRAPRSRTSCNTSNGDKDVELGLIHGTTDVDEEEL